VPFRLTRRRLTPLLAIPLATACIAPRETELPAPPAAQSNPAQPRATTAPSGVSAQPAAAAASAAGTQPTAAAQPAPAGALTFQVVPQQSKATFRVREQLAGRDLPNDAVGTTSAVSGQLAIRPDGTFVSDASTIIVDLRELQSDSAQRDGFIKRSTLQTDRFPTATFVPVRAEGLPTPLPASGEHTFRLAGQMTVHGVQQDITWDVKAARQGQQLTGTATTAVTFADFGMTAPKVPVVLSVVDEIRLEIALVATQV
jgi:polyisoprenoid-binding protein YceI